jgi:ribonuclease HI
MKQVTITSIGSCDTGTRKGHYEATLEYNGRSKYIRGSLEDTTANRCIIHGLIDGVLSLKEPCNVILVAATRLGKHGISTTKGPNADLLKRLIEALSTKNCEFELRILEGEGENLRRKVEAERTA